VTIGAIQSDAWLRVWEAGFIPVTEQFRAYIENLRKENPATSWSFANKARVFDV
jgi:hypothetical protein